jgi:hypothetical protein
MFYVGTFAKEVGVRGYGRWRAMIFHGPLQLGAVHVLAIEGAGSLLRGRNGVPETGNRYCRQQTDDGHDDHDFDEGESGSVFCVHGILDLLWFASSCVRGIGVPAVDDKIHMLELWRRKKVSLLMASENWAS